MFRLLSEDSYLFEGLQSADKTKIHSNKVTKCTNFYRKRQPLLCLFTFGNKNKTCTHQLLNNNQPIPT